MRRLFDQRAQDPLEVDKSVAQIAARNRQRHVGVELGAKGVVHHCEILEVCCNCVRREIGQILHRIAAGDRAVAEVVKGAHMLRIGFLKDLHDLTSDEITVILIGQRQRRSLEHLCHFPQIRHDELFLFSKGVLLVPTACGDAGLAVTGAQDLGPECFGQAHRVLHAAACGSHVRNIVRPFRPHHLPGSTEGCHLHWQSSQPPDRERVKDEFHILFLRHGLHLSDRICCEFPGDQVRKKRDRPRAEPPALLYRPAKRRHAGSSPIRGHEIEGLEAHTEIIGISHALPPFRLLRVMYRVPAPWPWIYNRCPCGRCPYR